MRILLLSIITLTSVLLNAQIPKNLERDAKKVYDATYNMDFNTILDYTYPKIFDIVDRNTMYETLDKTFQNDEFSIRFVNPTANFKYSDIKTIGNQKFCLISYNNALRMKFEEPLDEETVSIMTEAFQSSMKNYKITYEKERNGFLLEGPDMLIAISDSLTKNEWRFLNHDEDQIDFLDKILTTSVRKQLGL
ncbi:hypothetical protein [Flavobacterium sp.]|uniref:hypothetical protein n=1 Tax=Flavobacterium sp. TaxID=239 RepID=UPI0028BE1A58|nr:hypothetical protein [Flavobacterium sp.]